MDKPKLYEVSGRDEDGDVHTFATDDLTRAAAMKKMFDEDLSGVTMIQRKRD